MRRNEKYPVFRVLRVFRGYVEQIPLTLTHPGHASSIELALG